MSRTSYKRVESPYSGGGNVESHVRIPARAQAPVLQHPGFGRTRSGSSHQENRLYGYGGLTEEDARRGNAV